MKKKWVLTDVKTGIWHEALHISSGNSPDKKPGSWSIAKRTLHGGFTEGVDIIEVNNGALSFTIVPTRGMGLWKGRYDGCELGWKSPVTGPVNPMFVNPAENGGLGWLQGFDECIVRCGLNSNGPAGKDIVPDNNGNPSEVLLSLHGRIANSPAHHVDVTVVERKGGTELIISGIVDEAVLFSPCLRLETRISTVVGSNAVTIHDEVVNMNTVDRELELLYHCNFGEPFLEQGSLMVAPSRVVAPRDAHASKAIKRYSAYQAPTPGFVEEVYWHQLAADRKHNTLAMLRNKAGTKAVALRFNLKQLPCFVQWKNTAGSPDGYVTGLEPGTNFPNPKVFERRQGRVIKLPPGKRHTVDLTMEVHTTRKGVADVEQEVAALQGNIPTKVHPRPIPEWSLCQ